jgi:uncharacterized protein (TIGR00251 family)
LLQLRRGYSRVQYLQAGVFERAMAKALRIRVTARSARPGIGGWRVGPDAREELEVRVAEAPSDGAANDAVTRLLAKAFGISRSEVAIISGRASRHKLVELPFDSEEARRRLGG